MATWDGNNYYYSGQGVVLIGERGADGKAAGLIPVGNVSDLKISVATSVIEHKESQTGQRGIDLRLTTETKATLSATLENFTADNLALALRGSRTQKLAGAVTNEAPAAYFGKVSPLKWSQISSLTLSRGAQALTAYTNDSTPFDYKVNLDAGSIWMNDGSVQPVAQITAGSTNDPTGVTVSASAGASTKFTFASAIPTEATVGKYFVVTGLSGADAALVNGIPAEITQVTATEVYVNIDTFGKTITIGTPKWCVDGQVLDADYNYAAQNLVDPMMVGSLERFLRFEGLNTADENRPVVVEVFKFLLDPTKELSLLSDTVQQFVLEGNVLADQLQSTGSKYFRQILVR